MNPRVPLFAEVPADPVDISNIRVSMEITCNQCLGYSAMLANVVRTVPKRRFELYAELEKNLVDERNISVTTDSRVVGTNRRSA